jgi:hypothetical protein
MMMSVAAHAITSYVQFRALAEVLVRKGVLSRDELENEFAAMREGMLDKTIDEWFEADIAYHIKLAVQAAKAAEQAAGVETLDADEVGRARAMQSGQSGGAG